MKDGTNTIHCGDGIYAHWNGYNIEISVDHHNNDPVVYAEIEHLEIMLAFAKRMKDKK